MLKKITPIWIAAAVNGILFLLFFLFFHPVYDSREDVYILYLLSGGYGDAPTAMVHYNHIVHPFLGWIIKTLFVFDKQLNWYSIALYLAHYLSCTVILAAVIRDKNTRIAYASYGALFMVFEGYFLLFPDFTGASIALTTAGLLLLLRKSWTGKLDYRHAIAAGLLLLFASFYRLHSMIPLVGLSLPFFAFTTSKQAKWRAAAVLFISGSMIFLCNWVHQAWYRSQKPDWPQEEAYRQKVFRFFNETGSLKVPLAGEKWYDDYQLTMQGMTLDTSFMPAARLDSMYHYMKQAGPVQGRSSAAWRKWFFINNRLYFFLTALFIFLYGLRKKDVPVVLTGLVLVAGGFAYLLFTAKAPPYILISSLSFFCFAIFFNSRQSFREEKKNYAAVSLGLLVLFIAWGIVRLYKTSAQNSYDTYLFKQEYAEIAAHKDHLFIGIKKLRLHKFYAFDVPARYELSNYLHPERFMSNNYRSSLARFGLHEIKDIFSSPAVLFWGEAAEGTKAYFEKIAGKPLTFSAPLAGFKKGTVWRIE